MLKGITHIGVTVQNLERAVCFYRDVLGMKYQGRMVMEGKETDILFGLKSCRVELAYLVCGEEFSSPAIELIHIVDSTERNIPQLIRIGISEICFVVEDIDEAYRKLKDKGVVFLSEPQFFDFSSQGFGRSKAVYFRDSEGTILELIQTDL